MWSANRPRFPDLKRISLKKEKTQIWALHNLYLEMLKLLSTELDSDGAAVEVDDVLDRTDVAELNVVLEAVTTFWKSSIA